MGDGLSGKGEVTEAIRVPLTEAEAKRSLTGKTGERCHFGRTHFEKGRAKIVLKQNEGECTGQEKKLGGLI